MIGIDIFFFWYIFLVIKYKEFRSVECIVLFIVILCGSFFFSCFNIRKFFRKLVFCFIWLVFFFIFICIGFLFWICDGLLLKDIKGSKFVKFGGRVK